MVLWFVLCFHYSCLVVTSQALDLSQGRCHIKFDTNENVRLSRQYWRFSDIG